MVDGRFVSVRCESPLSEEEKESPDRPPDTGSGTSPRRSGGTLMPTPSTGTWTFPAAHKVLRQHVHGVQD
ncbi:hypothetical protein SprV_0602244900 [Sparganum proliferum]